MVKTNIFQQNWGLFDAMGSPIYVLQVTDSGSVFANDMVNQTYCSAKEGADPKMLQAALDWACGPEKVDCAPLMQGQACYEPDTVVSHATYAFDMYYHQMGKTPGSCDFNGVATTTTSNSSHSSCVFPGTSDRNGSLLNNTIPEVDSKSSGSPTTKFVYKNAILMENVVVGALLL